MEDTSCGPCLDRRRLLGHAAALGLAAPILAACGSDDTGSPSSSGSSDESPGGGSGSGTPDASAGGGAGLVATADVPVDGGVILDSEKIVVTQPTEGTFKAFSAVCTHQGCVVGTVEDGTITCPCHGSQFSAEDGSVVNGPATSPLAAVAVTVKGDQVVRS